MSVPPTTIGRFEVVRSLGVGGMGEVWLCRSVGAQGFSAEVVVKRVRPDRAARQRDRDMFVDEARLASRLSHPNVVKVFEFGEEEAGMFLAMEHVRGRDLADALAAGPPPPVGLAAHVTRCIAHALAHAHALTDEAGDSLALVHRDVSPHNVLLGYADEVKLSDFGVARSTARLRQTTGDGIKGKLRYLAPEQARGEPLDDRADVYALGLILFEQLTGLPALDGDDEAGLLAAASRGGLAPPPAAPEALRALLQRCLAVEAGERPTAAQMADSLDRFIVDHVSDPAELRVGPWLQARLPAQAAATAHGPAPGADSAAPTVGRRRRGPWVLLALLALSAALLVAMALLRSQPPPAARRASPVSEAGAGTAEVAPAQAAAAPGWLELQVRPHGKVWIDGRPFGDAPIRRKLTAGAHRVRVANKAMGKSKTLTVKVASGRRTRKTVELK